MSGLVFTGAAAAHTHTDGRTMAVRLLQQSCSTLKEVRGQPLTHSSGLDPSFRSSQPRLDIFFHPLTVLFSLHSSWTKQGDRLKLQCLGQMWHESNPAPVDRKW